MTSKLFPTLVAGLGAVLLTCTTAPPAPSPEQYFADAKNNLAAMEYDMALKSLSRLVKAAGEQPLGQQGRVLQAALLTAVADGNKRMAEAYAEGRKQPPAQTRAAEFDRMRSDYYGLARVHAIDAMQTLLEHRGSLSEQPIRLEVDFPSFSGTEPAALGKVKSGVWLDDTGRVQAQLESIRNALARVLASLVGAGDNVHKGREIFQPGYVQIDPRVYLLEMSGAFLRVGEIFDRTGLDDPRFRRIGYELARDNMDVVLQLLGAKPEKELEGKAKRTKAECEKKLKALGS